ncbi:MAG TPA: lysophospholipid acyltransferase family protein [Chloroflexota bacterium]|nr:lysophospholipid acyltransferase family protein [Chloroflexota bacterium]
MRELLQRLLFGLLRLVCRPLRIEGVERLRGLEPPFLLVANHASHLDTLLILMALPPGLRRRMAVAAAADYWFARPLLGGLAALLVNAFPMARRGCARAGLAACQALAEAGWALLVFPEGTRSPDGRPQPFKPGAGRLAVELGLPVVPVALVGSHACLPRGARWPRPGAAAVVFGAPLRFPANLSRDAATLHITNAVHMLHSNANRGASIGRGSRSAAPRASGGERSDGDNTGDHDPVQRGRRAAQSAVQDPAPWPLRV